MGINCNYSCRRARRQEDYVPRSCDFASLGITCQQVEQRNSHFRSGVNRLRPIFDPMFQANPESIAKVHFNDYDSLLNIIYPVAVHMLIALPFLCRHCKEGFTQEYIH